MADASKPLRMTGRRSPSAPVAAVGLVLVLIAAGLMAPLGGGLATAHTPLSSVLATANVVLPSDGVSAPVVAPAGATVGPWTNITGLMPNAPSAREGAVMAFDGVLGKLLLFGGYTGTRTSEETWLYGHNHWTNLTPTLSISPPPRQRAGLVDDTADGELLLFGGHNGVVYLNDTWTFNGTAWSQVPTPIAPSPREDFMIGNDPVDGSVILFGGEEASGHLLNDTWTFHAGVWTNLSSTIPKAPPPRESGAFAWDGADGYGLLYSGKSGATGVWNDTWTFANGAWTNRTLTVGEQPPKREEPSMVYDAVDSFVLMFGGLRYPNTLNDSWSFSGGQWKELPPVASPSPRSTAAMAFDANGGVGYVVLFGGQSSPSVVASTLGDTWTFKTPLKVLVRTASATIDLGESASLSAAVVGGYPPYVSYAWFGLPAPCASVNASSLSCTPNGTGTFDISVNVTDSGGFNGTSPMFPLHVNPDPAVVAGASTLSGDVPLTVDFTSTVTGGTAPLTYLWLFGDGGNATTAAPSHTYLQTGTFTAGVTVTDARNFTATETLSIEVLPPAVSLSASLDARPTSGVAPLTVAFTVAASGGESPYTYAWDFGDGTAPASTDNPSHTFMSAGTFESDVVVTDLLGDVVTEYTNITVLAPVPLTAVATATPLTGIAPLSVTFMGTGAGGSGPYQYAWTFGSSGTGTGASVAHTFTAPGVYTVSLRVTDHNLSEANASPLTVTVSAPLSTSFNATVGTPACVGGSGQVSVTVRATAAGGIGSDTFAWSFPSGVGAGANASTTVAAGSNSTIQLTATDSDQHTATSTQSVSVPAISCSSPAGGTTGTENLLILALILLVAAVVAVEVVLLVRRQKKTK